MPKASEDDGLFPNNNLPVIVYKNMITEDDNDKASFIDNLFRKNGWQGSWRNGVYGFHHYHSTAHEVLGIYSGSASIL